MAIPVPTHHFISHFHPDHPLTHYSDDQEYTCHICKTVGSGPRFRCQANCHVDIHLYCTDPPKELSSFLHSHRLALIHQMNHRRCNICRESINGMFYRCNHCDFDVHPLCTQFPEQLRHLIDGCHKLTFRKLSSGRCSICEEDCSSFWVYGCDVCRVNIHPKCILKPYGSPTGTRGIPYCQAPQWTTAPHPHGYGGGYFSYGGGQPNWGYPNHHVGYPHGGNNYGGQPPSRPSWVPMLGAGMFGVVQNLTAGAILEFIFGSFGA
ncbi:diacylglycerol kinase theta [Cucumis sativus]|uniref:Phorbol-ester/DAG-type domain-containing protein n=1 Tax=Cucumis sativus TaxID=3659 RepID=A0A0A0L121_CUCSA|nr:diacylglycerol kinase theta [Cucumis sativus]KGN54292.1 hypothetical protein Csa_018032 [Cucumis sativus]